MLAWAATYSCKSELIRAHERLRYKSFPEQRRELCCFTAAVPREAWTESYFNLTMTLPLGNSKTRSLLPAYVCLFTRV